MPTTKQQLRIIYMCVKCGYLYEGEEGYNLNYMYGEPRICLKCRAKAWA